MRILPSPSSPLSAVKLHEHPYTNKTNSVALVRERSILTERQLLVGEVSAKYLLIEVVACSAQWIYTAVFSDFYTGLVNFSSEQLSRPRSTSATSRKIW
jgi:hypothetical protein